MSLISFLSIWIILFIPCLILTIWAHRKTRSEKHNHDNDKHTTIHITIHNVNKNDK